MSQNKALQMDPHDSRVVTEYSAIQGSSSLSNGHLSGMDTTRILFALKQGPRSLENHIRVFIVFAHYSDLSDIILIEIFCDGINQPLRSQLRREGPRSSLSCFLDFALLTVGSLFTVGVADEDRDAASMTEMAATAEPVHKMAATTTPRHVSAASHESIQVKVDVKEPSQVTVDSSARVSLRLSSSARVSLRLSSSARVSLHLSSSARVSSLLSSSARVSSHLSSSARVSSRLSSSARVSSRLSSSARVSSRLRRNARVCHTQRFKVSPSSSLSGVQREGCTAGVCTRSWYLHAQLVSPNPLTLAILSLN